MRAIKEMGAILDINYVHFLQFQRSRIGGSFYIYNSLTYRLLYIFHIDLGC